MWLDVTSFDFLRISFLMTGTIETLSRGKLPGVYSHFVTKYKLPFCYYNSPHFVCVGEVVTILWALLSTYLIAASSIPGLHNFIVYLFIYYIGAARYRTIKFSSPSENCCNVYVSSSLINKYNEFESITKKTFIFNIMVYNSSG